MKMSALVQNIKASIYDQLLNTVKLTKDKFVDWYRNSFNDQRVSVDNLYNYYSQVYDKAHQNETVYPEGFLQYPFKSEKKRTTFRQTLQKDNFRQRDIETLVPIDSGPKDLKIKPLKEKFSRKTFSPSPGSWEIDHLEHTHGNNTYLLAINSNTRYLYAYPVHSKTLAETINIIRRLRFDEWTRFKHPLKSIRGDGDRGFNSLPKYIFMI